MNILIIASNRTLTLSLLRCLGANGHRAYVIANENYPVIKASRHCIGFSLIEQKLLNEHDSRLATIADKIAMRTKCAVVMPSGVDAVLYLSRQSETIRSARVVPLASPHIVHLMDDKASYGRFACAAGVTVPKTETITDFDAVDCKNQSFPLVVKPLDWDGSRGVHVVHNSKELARRLAEFKLEKLDRLLLQQYVPGQDLSISVLADHGQIKAWEIHAAVGRDSDFQYVCDSDVVQMAAILVATARFHGFANLDFRRHEVTGELYALECNPRPWASIHIAACAGMNFAQMAIDMALGIELQEYTQATDIFIQPERAIKRILAGKLKISEISAATKRGIEMDRKDAFASFVRLLEKYAPGFTELMSRKLQKTIVVGELQPLPVPPG